MRRKHTPLNAKSLFSALLVLFALNFPALAVNAGDELPFGKIFLGMSTALTGPASDLGRNMLLGVRARLAEENRRGGIKGRPLHLITRDDGYEPDRAARNVRYLIEIEKVLTIIGNVGTPTAISAIPIINEKQTLFFAPFTGAGVLRKSPPDKYVINYRASYAEETSAMIDALMSSGKVALDEIAFFTQRDGYGDAGYLGGITALLKHGLVSEALITHSRYDRNTLAVENSIADILLAKPVPKVIIMVGAYAPSAHFIRLAREVGINALFLNVSFVGSTSLARELGSAAERVMVTQVVPHPDDELLPLVRKYTKSLFEYDPQSKPSFGSFEGYISAEILMLALNSLQSEPTRENIVEALEGLGRFDIGMGEELYLDAQNHQASHKVWPTLLKKGKFVSFNWAEIEHLLR
ncbi:MAG: ABC transporter substrate-binding protein [Sneathiella sp.]